jgi:hypothetical protein
MDSKKKKKKRALLSHKQKIKLLYSYEGHLESKERFAIKNIY